MLHTITRAPPDAAGIWLHNVATGRIPLGVRHDKSTKKRKPRLRVPEFSFCFCLYLSGRANSTAAITEGVCSCAIDTKGGRYIYFTWRTGGMDAVLGRFAQPPTMTHTLLASTMDAVDSQFTASEVKLAAPPAEWTELTRMTLGAWGMHLAFEKTLGLDASRAMALAWRGDTLGIYASSKTPAHSAVVWRLELADEVTAIQAKAAAERLVGVANVRQEGQQVIIAKTDGSLPVDWAFQFD